MAGKLPVLEQLAKDFELQKLKDYYTQASSKFRPQNTDVSEVLTTIKDPRFDSITQIGEIEYDNANRIGFFVCPLNKDLAEKTSKKIQYDIGKKLLKANFYDAGIFVFYGANKSFRLSLIAASYLGPKREFTTFRRYTYFVSPELTNKTLIKQLSKCDFSSIEKILQAFSIEAVSEEFYNSFKPKFDEIASSIQGGKIDSKTKQDFALLFAIRVIFLGFVEKRGWLGGNEKFIQSFWAEYNLHKQKSKCSDEFYTRWLEPLFFEALNSAPGKKVEWKNNEFSPETEKTLQMAPFLNGELFKRKQDVDERGFYLPDKIIGEFLEFLFQYNFTIDENTAYDEELELNPEFLGIIFERFVNQELGAIYTPRTEVDLMCRLSLLRWLEKKNEFDAKELHHLFFREGGKGAEFEEDQKDGNFSEKEIRKLLEFLENVTVCDPAAGSGAFEVGMLQVINETIEKLHKMPHFPKDVEKKEPYERKKDIIAKSLYGVEVQGYAVWINQLRLWLTLFIDMPDEMKSSLKPLLPCLNFKVRRGDSLVQRIGNKMFPVHGHADINSKIKNKITDLKKSKIDFYYNAGIKEEYVKKLENDVFREIIQSQIDEIDERIKRLEEQKTKGASGSQALIFEDEQGTTKTLQTPKSIEYELGVKSYELSQELKNLKDEHPLIWNIEFAEIFYDKDGFDIIIGNPPYIRQEDIADPEGKVKPNEYKKLLYEMSCLDYPKHFKNISKIDGHSDLYTFFYLRSLHLLNKGGVHCFICSNSWLDVGYGVWVQEFLLANVPVHYVIDNHVRRSFSTVDVNTIISLFDAPDNNYDKHNHLVKFIAFKKPFEECIFTENLWQLHQVKEIIKNDTFRVYPITAEELYDEGWEVEEGAKKETGKYIGDKWGGRYLRAPDIFFTILQKGKDKLVKLKSIADVRFGIKTGCNEFFYLTDAQANEWGIGEEFLKPVIKSPRECQTILISPDKLKYKIFMCNKSKNELKGTNIYKYIQWGEKKKNLIDKGKTIVGVNNLSFIKKRKIWWSVDEVVGNSFWGKELRERLAVFVSSNNIACDCRLYTTILCKELQLFCNSTVYHFLGEVLKRDLGGGGGPRSVMVFEVKNSLVLKSELINPKINLPVREILPIFEECGIDPQSKIPIEEQEPKPLPDRKELDDIIFDALGLTATERKDVYRALCRLVWNRLSKAKSV